MICHCFLRPIRRDLTSSSYTTGLSLGGGENHPFLLIKIRPIFIPTSAIANNGVTIRDLIGRDEKTRGRGKRKVFTRNFKGEYVETRCLGNERFRSSDEYCVKERNERKEETEKYHQLIRQYEPGTGYFLQPRPQVPFSWLWRWAHHLQSQGKATWGRGCTCHEDHEPTIADRGRGG